MSTLQSEDELLDHGAAEPRVREGAVLVAREVLELVEVRRALDLDRERAGLEADRPRAARELASERRVPRLEDREVPHVRGQPARAEEALHDVADRHRLAPRTSR